MTQSPDRLRQSVRRVVAPASLWVLAAIGFVSAAVGDASAAQFVYVANGSDGTVSVVDADTNALVKIISMPSGGFVRDLVVTPDGARVYVASGSTVSVIDTSTNRVLGSPLTVGDAAAGMAVTPDGRFVYVASRLGGTVAVIDASSNVVVATIPVVLQPIDVAVTPDGARVYVAGGGDFVRVIDAASNTIVSSVFVGEDAYAIAVSPDGSKVYVLLGDSVSVIQTASNTVSATIPVSDSGGIAVSPDGTRLYISAGGAVMVVDTASNTVLTVVTLPRAHHNGADLALSPDGTRAYWIAFGVNGDSRMVFVIDTTVNAVVGDPIFVPVASGGYPFAGNGIAAAPPPVGGLMPPIELSASSIVGNQVTLTWTPRATSVEPTGYVIEGGISPGEVLASIPTGSTAPRFTFTAPTGAFYVRVHTLAGIGKSGPSNEIPLFVNVPASPLAPSNLLGLVNGTSVTLAWRNTYGGVPTSFLLDVDGSFDGTLPLPPGETATFHGVPPGTYTLRLRAANASGTSAASNPLTLTVPASCTGVPHVPVNLAVTRAGNVISVTFDPPESGPAPTGFVLLVTGATRAAISVPGRSISGAVESGSYTVWVFATNACGTGPFTAPQTIVVP